MPRLISRLLSGIGRDTRAAPPVEPAPLHPDASQSATRKWLLRAFFGGQIAAAAVLFLIEAPRLSGDYTLFAVLVLLDIAVSRLAFLAYGDVILSSEFAIIMAILVFFGAPGAIIAAPFGRLAARFRPSDLRYSFNFLTLSNSARFVIIGWVSGVVYGVFAQVGPSELDTGLIPAAVSVTAVTFALYFAFSTLSLYLRKGQSFESARSNYVWLAPHFVALGMVGIALAASYIALGYLGIVAFCMPVLMMRFAQKQYVDKTAESVEQLRDKNAALEKANVEIRSVSEELRVTYDATLEALVGALDARDQETKGHSIRVAEYMLTIAGALGVTPGTQEWVDMQRGALLHDVGKIGVSDNILLKPGKLTPEEWVDMRRHPEIGYNILREVKFLSGAAEIVLAHHERWDGQGYPRGLREEEVPLGSRIFTVVDTFDSMTSDRPYRKALSAKTALDEILRCGGSQFDPLVVEAFLDIYEKWVLERSRLHGVELKTAA